MTTTSSGPIPAVRPEEPLTLYADGLADVRSPGRPGDGPWFLCFDDGNRVGLELARWCGDGVPGDDSLLERCQGPCLDVGCGPGRLAAALRERGLPVLGLDISPEAVRIARRRGALVMQRSVFDALPAEGTWRHALLADGNVGIGGHPTRLLRRCAELVDGHGTVLVELDPPGTPHFTGRVRIESASGRVSDVFPWARVSTDDITQYADAAGLRVAECWDAAGRWFAALRS